MVIIILEFDWIVTEANKLRKASFILQRDSKLGSPKEKMRLKDFSETISNNFPQFSAARFVAVSRSTVLSVLGCVTTFIIVLIQFRAYSG